MADGPFLASVAVATSPKVAKGLANVAVATSPKVAKGLASVASASDFTGAADTEDSTDVVDCTIVTSTKSVLKTLEGSNNSSQKSTLVIPKGSLQVKEDEDEEVLIHKGVSLLDGLRVVKPEKKPVGLLARIEDLLSRIFETLKEILHYIIHIRDKEVSSNTTVKNGVSKVSAAGKSSVALPDGTSEGDLLQDPDVRRYIASLDHSLGSAKLRKQSNLFTELEKLFNDPNSSSDARRALLSDVLAKIEEVRDSLYTSIPNDRGKFTRTLNTFHMLADLLRSAVEGRDNMNIAVPMICRLVREMMQENDRFSATVDTEDGGTISGTMNLSVLSPGSINNPADSYASSFNTFKDPVVVLKEDGKIKVVSRSHFITADWMHSNTMLLKFCEELQKLQSIYKRTDIGASDKNKEFDVVVKYFERIVNFYWKDMASHQKGDGFNRSGSIARHFHSSLDSMIAEESANKGRSEQDKAATRESWIKDTLSNAYVFKAESEQYMNVSKGERGAGEKAFSGSMLDPDFALTFTPDNLLTAESPATSQNVGNTSSVVTGAVSSGPQGNNGITQSA